MKKISLYFLTLLFFIQSALAKCTLNGKEVPCSEMPNWFYGLMGWFGVIFFVLMVFMLVSTAFWIWMLVDCAKYEKEKVPWLLVIIFAGFIGAIIYFIVMKSQRKKKRK